MKKLFFIIKKKGIKHIVLKTIPWYLDFYIDKWITFFIKLICLKSQLQDIIIIESHNDFDSNGGAFFQYLIDKELNKKYKIVWFLRNKKEYNLPDNVEYFFYEKPSIKKSYYYVVAKYIVCGHQIIPSIRDEQISYYTTHGGFSLKAFKGNVCIPDNMTYILAPNSHLHELLADSYMLDFPNNRMISIGFPVHDILYSNNSGDLSKLTETQYKKVILWMPTFRKSVNGRNDLKYEQKYGIPIINSIENYEKLNQLLVKENVLLIIKIHPMQDLREIKLPSLSHIRILDGKSVKELNIDNYRLMKDTDALISDYSSVAYDYLHLDRPIGYTMDDADDYVGFIVDNPQEYIAGPIIYCYNDLCNFIKSVINNEDLYIVERQKLFNKIWEYKDGNSSHRLAKHMNLI